jgi:lipoate-protein ligase A
VDLVRQEGPLTVKRFSGGGTVVLDHSSLWTTFIGRTALMPDIQPFPRSIMQWSADEIFSPAFSQLQQDALLQSSASSMTAPTPRLQKTLMMQGKSCGVENSGRAISMPIHNDALLSNNNNNSRQTVPDFALRENDYVMGEQKIGGNAQSIVKGGWLHHTSFLWDFEEENMNYLSLPSKRPDYRGDRPHDAFLLKLQPLYNKHHSIFFDRIQDAASAAFSELDHITTEEALNIVDTELGGLQHYFDNKCRTKIIQV